MLREFIKSVGRFRAGEIRDYPKATWDDLANGTSLKLDQISKPVVSASAVSNREAAKQAAHSGVKHA